MRTFDSAQKAADLLGRQFWGFYDRVDRCWMPKIDQPKRGPLRLKSRGCSLTVPMGSTLTADELVAAFVIQHGGCMAQTIRTVAADPLARDPRCQCLSDRRRRVA